jgi:3-dehydroquinate synthase
VQHHLLKPEPGPAPETSIVVGAGALDALPITVQGAPLVLAVADRSLARGPVGEAVRARLAAAEVRTELFAIEASEQAKSLAAVSALWDAWLEAGAGRDAVVVAVGGGIITDVTGFAAASYLRGIPWVAIPTTVIGIADAAIGGKTGVNLSRGKNLVGAIHPPRAVLADFDLLASLPDEDYRDGWSEVVKAGVIADAPLLADLTARAQRILARDPVAMEETLIRAIAVKAAVVEKDLLEGSRREILNFGHTVGHALEHATGNTLSHGRAVAAGMVAEAVLAVTLGRLGQDAPELIATACGALGIPWRVESTIDEAAFVAALSVDKKRRAGRIRVALPDSLGAHSSSPSVEVDPQDLVAALHVASRMAS